MHQASRKVSLGFTEQEFAEGVHICQIFKDEEERHKTLAQYLVSGLRDKEAVCCFSDRESDVTLSQFLNAHELSLEECRTTGALEFAHASAVYFQDGVFDPDRMLALLQEFHETSREYGRAGARVIGEMAPQIQSVRGGELLMTYESRVNQLLRTCPVTAVCQYDARLFDGATIFDILKVHAFMLVHGTVVRNPFFIPPEEVLAQTHGRA